MGFDGNNKIYEKESCILIQDGQLQNDYNEYFMDYFIYLNGMRVCCYFIDHDYNGNVNESASYYCLYDGQGNIVQLSNKVGDMPYTLFKYDSYGNTLEAETDGDEAESGLYKGYDHGAIYFKTGVRHYDPDTGTFLSPDPFKGYMGDPQSQHPYMYCHGNPIRYYDPSGYNGVELMKDGTLIISSSPCTGPYIGAAAIVGATFLVIGKIVDNNQEYYDQAGIQLQVEIKRGISQWQEYTVPTAMDPVVSRPIDARKVNTGPYPPGTLVKDIAKKRSAKIQKHPDWDPRRNEQTIEKLVRDALAGDRIAKTMKKLLLDGREKFLK
jgi:RHS repeat-associated protein